jgi:arylsulfatase A-like enzyme
VSRPRVSFGRGSVLPIVAALVLAGLLLLWAGPLTPGDELPSFREQICGLPDEMLARIERGHLDGRSGDISILPKQPAYMASGAGGWSHSGPWEYLQHIPLIFYGPGIFDPQEVDRPVTLADVAPTQAALVRASFDSDGAALEEVASLKASDLTREPPRLILTIVWDGGGWNGLEEFPDAWPNLKRLMDEGVSYTEATVGSSPSVTPSTHTTLGTGVFPDQHGITGIPVRGDSGAVEDSFQKGESSSYMEAPAFAERWDEQTSNKALVGMVGYEPWHLGMIGQGAERPGGDKDDAAWLDIDTNEWITNADYYTLPEALTNTGGLDRDLDSLDAADGMVDGDWGERTDFISDRIHWEETPAFVHYHGRGLRNLISQRGYGRDDVTDFVFTNFKQIDRVAHYFSMHADEVRDSMVASDEELGRIVNFLDREVGRGKYVVIVTADHGMQPDETETGGYGINPTALEEDIRAEFGAVLRGIWPTEAFVFPDKMEEADVTVEEIARFIGDYRLGDNIAEEGTGGSFEDQDRLFELAVPSDMLTTTECEGSGEATGADSAGHRIPGGKEHGRLVFSDR